MGYLSSDHDKKKGKKGKDDDKKKKRKKSKKKKGDKADMNNGNKLQVTIQDGLAQKLAGFAGSKTRSKKPGQDSASASFSDNILINREQLFQSLNVGIDHFGTKYGDPSTATRTMIEWAPKFDYQVLEKENAELRKTYDPLKAELSKEKNSYRLVLAKYNKLQASVNYTNAVSLFLLTIIVSQKVRRLDRGSKRQSQRTPVLYE